MRNTCSNIILKLPQCIFISDIEIKDSYVARKLTWEILFLFVYTNYYFVFFLFELLIRFSELLFRFLEILFCLFELLFRLSDLLFGEKTNIMLIHATHRNLYCCIICMVYIIYFPEQQQ